MTTKKTVRVSEASEAIPAVVPPQHLDKTRELPDAFAAIPDEARLQAAPCAVVDDEVTVPVQSSIESTVTFELLRRQSQQASGDEDAGSGAEDGTEDGAEAKR